MNITFPEANDELEVIADATGISTNKGGQYIIAKWGKTKDSKFLKIEIVMDKDQYNVINAEVTTNEVETAVKTVKDLQDKGKKVKKFYGKLMMLMRFTRPGLMLLPHLGRTLLLGVAIQLGCKGVQEVIIVGGRRRVTVLGGGLSPYSPLYFWGIC